jgi:hypothetical protein
VEGLDEWLSVLATAKFRPKNRRRRPPSFIEVFMTTWSGDRKPDAQGKVPPVGDSVDLSVPSWTNSIGASELGGVWTDPDSIPS